MIDRTSFRPSRSPRRLAARVLTPILAALLLPSIASATVVAGLDREALVRGADGIVAGVVRSVRAIPGPAQGPDILTAVQIEVSQVYKELPELVGGVLTLTQTGGTLGGKTLHIHGQATFTEGEPVLLFVERLFDGRLMPFGMAQGKFTLQDHGDKMVAVRQLEDLTFAPRGPAGLQLGAPDPVRFPVRFDLDELERMIAALTVPGADAAPRGGSAPGSDVAPAGGLR